MEQPIKATLEALLYVSPRPLSLKKLCEYADCSTQDAKAALHDLMEEYKRHAGLQLNRVGDMFQFSTTAAAARAVEKYLEEEEKKELTKPSLETLTIIAYRGPIAKAEIELIRGVNCSMILRNLLIRGLIEEEYDASLAITRYKVTFDFLHYLGLREPQELPDFLKLNSNENLEKLLHERQDAPDTTTDSADEPSITV